LPIYKNDEERTSVLEYCESLKTELAQQTYDGAAVRVRIDDRDLRGGEKKWQWVKRGVPLRVEVGPRDVAGSGAFVARRDQGTKGTGTPRAELVANIATILEEMQQSLFDRAKARREESTIKIDTLAEFEKYFAEDSPAGFALCHFVDGPEMEAKCKELKITARCIPLEAEAEAEAGTCLFSGARSEVRGVFARAY
jgi:prolyl-tRNA synthetase